MRVVVTGGAGFLGSHLCATLLDLGHQVLCIDNLVTGALKNIEPLRKNQHFDFQLHDITKPIEVAGAVDAVLHLASPASPRDYLRLPIPTLEAGAFGTSNALRLAKTQGARFLLASTSEVYGDPKVHPQTESYWGNVNPIGPRSAYDEAKRFAEALVMAYHRHERLDARIARIFNTYGPGMRLDDGRVVSNFITQALQRKKLTVCGDGNQTRSFCYVGDMVDGLMRLLLARPDSLPSHETCAKERIHEPINLGNPEEIKVKDLAQTILRLTGSSSQIEERSLPADDPKRRCPDIARIQKLLGWQPKVSLQEGLISTIEYFRQAMREEQTPRQGLSLDGRE